eukprot:SAG31_NODE_6795_length_1884_cov_1.763025_1_plen_292_part_10
MKATLYVLKTCHICHQDFRYHRHRAGDILDIIMEVCDLDLDTAVMTNEQLNEIKRLCCCQNAFYNRNPNGKRDEKDMSETSAISSWDPDKKIDVKTPTAEYATGKHLLVQHRALEVIPGLFKGLFVIDFDNGGLQSDYEQLPDMWKKLPYTKGNTPNKGFHFYVIIRDHPDGLTSADDSVDIPGEFSWKANEDDQTKVGKGDVRCGVTDDVKCIWEKVDAVVYNWHGVIPEMRWAEVLEPYVNDKIWKNKKSCERRACVSEDFHNLPVYSLQHLNARDMWCPVLRPRLERC